MYIHEIILDGFKSYSSRVVVGPLHPQFNAITGLNGTGKSNILDSICFVLGISNHSLVSPTVVPGIQCVMLRAYGSSLRRNASGCIVQKLSSKPAHASPFCAFRISPHPDLRCSMLPMLFCCPVCSVYLRGECRFESLDWRTWCINRARRASQRLRLP